MEPKQLKLPQLKIVTKGSNKVKFLERLANDTGKPYVNLIFQKDNNDSRIISIKYVVPGREMDDSILYYSEAFNKHTIITSNLGYNYEGRIVVKDFNGNKIGVSMEHSSKKEFLRREHIERINQINGIRRDLTEKYVSERCEGIVYSLPESLGK